MSETTTDVVAEGTTTGAPATNTQPDWESAANPYKEFKGRFTGLQGTYEKTANELKAIKTAKNELEESLKKITGDKEVAALELTQWQQKYGDISGQLDTVKAREERTWIVATQFTDLLPFLGDGKPEGDLLPSGTGEELTKKLTTFREAMQKQGVEKVRDALGGATPPGAPDTKPKTASEYFSLAIEAQRAGKMADYDAYYTKYLEAKKA